METKTPTMYGRSGSTTLLQLALLRQSDRNFSQVKPQWDNTVIKQKKRKKLLRELINYFGLFANWEERYKKPLYTEKSADSLGGFAISH